MAHVTTPRWLSPVSRRIVVIVIAAAAALMLLTSILVTSASAADPIRVRNVQGDACQSTRLGVDAFGVAAFEVVIPRGDVDANYSRTFDLPNGGELTLSAPPNRAFVDFSMTGATADGGILFNRTDQKEGNLYDYRPEGGVTEGRLEPPPRDQGNEKQVVFCFAVAPAISIDVTTSGSGEGPGDEIFIEAGAAVTWTYTVTNTGDVPLATVMVTDSKGVTPTFSGGDTNSNSQLDLTETWVWTATGTAETSAIGSPYMNTGTVTAFYGVEKVTASDVSSYFGSDPDISVVATTSGSNLDGIYAGPGDDTYVKVGDTVTWEYAVTNTGNVKLTNIGVTDTDVTGILCEDDELDPGAPTTCTATGTAVESAIDVFFTNSGTASGTPPVGAAVTSIPDVSSYFGYVASLTITATLNGVAVPVAAVDPNPVVTSGFTWVFTLTNTGNVEVDGVIVDESGARVTCDPEGELDPIPPGDVSGKNPATCTVTQNSPSDLEVTTTFTVTGDDPNGIETSDTTESITYFVGIGCGESTQSGGRGLADTPLAGFFVGPVKGEGTLDCAIPVEISTTNDEGGDEQTVFIGPPSGYGWDRVTGLLTVEWDAESAGVGGVRPTFQEIGSVLTEIPTCAGDRAVEIDEPTGVDFLYTLSDKDALYPNATAAEGDICLVLHTTKTVNFNDGSGQIVKTVTVEVFYIWNDPQLVRPK